MKVATISGRFINSPVIYKRPCAQIEAAFKCTASRCFDLSSRAFPFCPVMLGLRSSIEPPESQNQNKNIGAEPQSEEESECRWPDTLTLPSLRGSGADCMRSQE